MPAEVNMREIIHEAVSFETAHVCEHYPFGNKRCLQKIWVETAEKGTKKNMQRVVTCTTKATINDYYTELVYGNNRRMFSHSTGAENSHPLAMLSEIMPAEGNAHYYLSGVLDNKAYWNKPKPANYYDMMLLYKRPIQKGEGEGHHFGLVYVQRFFLSTMYSQPHVFQACKELLVGNDLSCLRNMEQSRYLSVESANRTYNRGEWERWVHLEPAERAVAVQEYIRVQDANPLQRVGE